MVNQLMRLAHMIDNYSVTLSFIVKEFCLLCGSTGEQIPQIPRHRPLRSCLGSEAQAWIRGATLYCVRHCRAPDQASMPSNSVGTFGLMSFFNNQRQHQSHVTMQTAFIPYPLHTVFGQLSGYPGLLTDNPHLRVTLTTDHHQPSQCTLIISAAFSAMAYTVWHVFPPGRVGMTLASTIRSRSTPYTRSC